MLPSIPQSVSATPAPVRFVPPLDIAREQARTALAEADALDITIATTFEIARAYGAMEEGLRQVLAALDYEDGRCA
ncbi:hypothetical protein ACIQPQ_34735 [Streptomyces sp. NPDC091281]|uniref:hypothetical protein n=1 Tax=Streptomyces sp. NPDC091281 TaxID=3365985 RepID=UPI0037F9D43E